MINLLLIIAISMLIGFWMGKRDSKYRIERLIVCCKLAVTAFDDGVDRAYFGNISHGHALQALKDTLSEFGESTSIGA